MTYTWTKFAAKCTCCGATFRVSQQAIDETRKGTGCTETDQEIAESLEFCIECVSGLRVEGEHVCEGEQNDNGPCCEGTDVQTCKAREWIGGEWFTTRWCSDGRDQAMFLGYEFTIQDAVTARD